MELNGIGIEDITSCLSLGGGRRILLGAPALAGGVVDGHSRLDVVAEDTEGEACPLVLYGESLSQGLYLGGPGQSSEAGPLLL